MTAGLQIFNASGQIILDGTYRCGRILAFTQIVGGQAGSVSDARFSQGALWYAVQRDKTYHLSSGFGGICQPNFSFSGNTLSWSFAAQNSGNDEYAGGYLCAGVF